MIIENGEIMGKGHVVLALMDDESCVDVQNVQRWAFHKGIMLRYEMVLFGCG